MDLFHRRITREFVAGRIAKIILNCSTLLPFASAVLLGDEFGVKG
jgi:hypothetical protein